MKKLDNHNLTIINTLFLAFPLSCILGNLFINLNIFLFCIFAFIFYKKEKIKFKINLFDKIILIFFSYTFLVLIINFLDSRLGNEVFPEIIIYKTVSYLRYFVLYIMMRILVGRNILKLDWFFLTCAICASFVCFDIFFQFFFGKDIFGIEAGSPRHFSGVFGQELIAGGYLQKFSIFAFFLPFVIKKKNFLRSLIQIALFIFFICGIILSGNRMPFILFLLFFFIFIFFDKQIKKYFFSISVVILLFLTLHFNTNQTFKLNVSNFYAESNLLISSLILGKSNLDLNTLWRPYISETQCAISAIKENPIFGGGIRFYRTNLYCNTHPHNYYFEILSDLGTVGLSILLIFLFMIFRKIFIKKNTLFNLNFNPLNEKIAPLFFVVFIEFFPLRSSGSFFSTNNASLIFIFLALLVSLISQKKDTY